MKLLVAVKRVVDYNARIRVKADQVNCTFRSTFGLFGMLFRASNFTSIHCLLQTGVELANVKMSMNPFCEIAIEVICHDPCDFALSLSGKIASAFAPTNAENRKLLG